MYRRIELINAYPPNKYQDDWEYYKHGLMGISNTEIVDAWLGKDENDPYLRGPWRKSERTLPRNCKFYFTEKGWDKIGRKVIAACMRTGQQYRVIRIKHNELHIVWEDKVTGYEVAGQPRKDKK